MNYDTVMSDIPNYVLLPLPAFQASQKMAKQAAIAGIDTQAAPGLRTSVTSVTRVRNVGARAIKDIIVLRNVSCKKFNVVLINNEIDSVYEAPENSNMSSVQDYIMLDKSLVSNNDKNSITPERLVSN